MPRPILMFLPLLLCSLPLLAQTGGSPEARQYVDDFFALVSSRALDRDTTDWAGLRRWTDSLAAGAQVPGDTHAALGAALQRLNRHARLIDPDFARRWASAGGGGGETTTTIQDIPQVTGRRIGRNVAYLSVPQVGSGHGPTLTHFADSAQALIARLDGPQITGWIVDLRANLGGNCWPMLAGLGPVLGEGVCGYFMDRDGGNAQPWSYRDGEALMFDTPQSAVSAPPYRLRSPHPRVAVLTGPRTASSGEVMTVAFRGRPDTRSFGRPTAGLSTTNTTLPLSDGALVNLTVSVFGDREKRGYGEEIAPDVATDDPLPAALHWLAEDTGTEPCPPALRDYLTGFSGFQTEDFGFLDHQLTDVRLVGFGEDSHGAAEFTELARGLLRYLVDDHGFGALILETMVGEGHYLDAYVRGERDDLDHILAEINSSWRYRTAEFAELLRWIRHYNATADDPIRVYGCEMQYVAADVRVLQDYLDRVGEAYRIEGFDKHLWQPLTAAERATNFRTHHQLRELFDRRRAAFVAASSEDDYARALRHLAALGQFVAASGQEREARKHDLRDLYMAENIQRILELEGRYGRALFWAHNAHVGDWVSNGNVDVAGHHLARALGDRYYALATDFGSGAVAAFGYRADGRMGPFDDQPFALDPSTVTACFRVAGAPYTFLDLRAARWDPALRTFADRPWRLMAGTGAAAYASPVHTVPVGRAFDGLIYLERVSPIRPAGRSDR